MGVMKKNKKFIIMNNSKVFDSPVVEVATQEEMENYILNMDAPTIRENGRDLIIEFKPFPTKYVNYIKQRQYKGQRTQVYWQLARYVNRYIKRKFFDYVDTPTPSWRDGNLFGWTFPIRRNKIPGEADIQELKPYRTNKPFIFTLKAEEATLGKIVWKEGAAVIRYFFTRHNGNEEEREIAILIGVSKPGGEREWNYNKSESYVYNFEHLGPPIPDDWDEDPRIVELLNEVEVSLTEVEDDIFVSFSNVNQELIDYADENKSDLNKGLFLQTFSYFGGSRLGGDGVEQIGSPSKNTNHRKYLSSEDLTNGFFLGDQKYYNNGWDAEWPEETTEKSFLSMPKHKARYKYEEITYYYFSVALVLAHPGMRGGFTTYKESNKINRL